MSILKESFSYFFKKKNNNPQHKKQRQNPQNPPSKYQENQHRTEKGDRGEDKRKEEQPKQQQHSQAVYMFPQSIIPGAEIIEQKGWLKVSEWKLQFNIGETFTVHRIVEDSPYFKYRNGSFSSVKEVPVQIRKFVLLVFEIPVLFHSPEIEIVYFDSTKSLVKIPIESLSKPGFFGLKNWQVFHVAALYSVKDSKNLTGEVREIMFRIKGENFEILEAWKWEMVNGSPGFDWNYKIRKKTDRPNL